MTISAPPPIPDTTASAPRSPRLRAIRRRTGHLAELAGLVAVMGLFACLPVDWASALGAAIGLAIGPRIGASRRALRNIRLAMPENDEPENRRILRGMWANLGRSMAEYPHLAGINAAGAGRVEIVNEAGLSGLASSPRILFGGHLANWEVGPSTMHRLLGDRLLSVYRAANNPWVDRLMRRFHGVRHAVPKGAAGSRELVRHLRHGGSVAMLADQKQNDGIAVPFFGRDAMTAPAIARLAYRFDCPLVPVRVERLRGARFRCTVMAPIEMTATGSAAGDVRATMARVNGVLEGWVRACPEQWLWLHSRWPS